MEQRTEDLAEISDLKKCEIDDIDPRKLKVRDVINAGVQQQLKDIRQELLELVNNAVNDMTVELQREVNKIALNGIRDTIEKEKYSNRTKPVKQNTLPSKQFLPRDSLLTDLYKNVHIRTIYNIVVATLIVMLMHTVIYDIRQTGTSNLGLGTVRAGFGKLWVVLCVWPLMKACTLGTYIAFYCWATYRLNYSPQSILKKVWDYTWLATFIVYIVLFLVLPPKIVVEYELPIASTMIVIMEQLRLMMKTYAFVRTVAPRFLSYKPHSDMPAPELPGFSKYLYFMFVPTLIYRDSYPRSNKIRWNVVLTNLVEVVVIIFIVAHLYEKLLYPNYRDFGKQSIDVVTLVLNIFGSMLPGVLLLFCGFYLLLHSWMNAFAELLRFADKMFYQDWWTSICYRSYYRTWNIVVHDWLYTYVYKDMYEIVTRGNKNISSVTVFLVSAIAHEYILSCGTRTFCPMMILQFGGLGILFYFTLNPKRQSVGNVILWVTLCIGCGVFVGLYCMEYFARINCPPLNNDIWSWLVPRTLTCVMSK